MFKPLLIILQKSCVVYLRFGHFGVFCDVFHRPVVSVHMVVIDDQTEL